MPPVLVKCGAVLLLALTASGATGVSAHGTLYGRWNAAPMTGGRAAGEAGHGPSTHWEKARIGLVTGGPFTRCARDSDVAQTCATAGSQHLSKSVITIQKKPQAILSTPLHPIASFASIQRVHHPDIFAA
ncbi:uncharacterized protein TrAtP1_011235 [Trichoderma atroviride]|uniref:uncharacterized protein n=1 Tax=Hypocrea atroviridis TaxID=63577 RepID=UPI00331E5266|nr:hypothetical protein TrAtP1_011235 [Trichoderma atroviride]